MLFGNPKLASVKLSHDGTGTRISYLAPLKAREIPVTYLQYPDEGHGFTRLENNLSYMAAAEAFFDKYLGWQVRAHWQRFRGIGA